MAIVGQKKMENLLYLALWFVMFTMPVAYLFVHHIGNRYLAFGWPQVLESWRLIAAFCVAFYLHNVFVAPLIVYKNRTKTYVACLLALVVCFQLYQCSTRPDEPMRGGGGEEPMERRMDKRPPMPPEQRMRHGGEPIPRRQHAPMPFGGQDVAGMIIVLLLFGFNDGMKYYFRSQDERKKLREMERHNLEKQLEYLKYQINPHFFMNTLNNIHALVDIDAEEAKKTIEVLSKLMRYMLYDSGSNCAPLQKELNFLRHYVDLMRIRYTDSLKINLSFPDDVPNRMVPPLIFVTFVENAFKHGISYERQSYINVSLEADSDGVTFRCINSRRPDDDDEGGVGLKNTRQRLDLIYDKHYSLRIEPTESEFSVELRMPYLEQKAAGRK